MEIRSGLELFVIEPFILTELVTVPVILTDRIDPTVTAIRIMDMVTARPFHSDLGIRTMDTIPTITATTRTATTTAPIITMSRVTLPGMDPS